MKITATCPTCGAELELEDLAPGTAVECPACNHALTVPEPPRARGRIAAHRPPAPSPSPAPSRPSRTTIQRTDKKWKVLSLLGFLLLAAGIVAGIGAEWKEGPWIFVILGAFLLRGIARVGRWWTND